MNDIIKEFRDGTFALRTRQFGTVAELMIEGLYNFASSHNQFHDRFDENGNKRIEIKFSTVMKANEAPIGTGNVIDLIKKANLGNRALSSYEILVQNLLCKLPVLALSVHVLEVSDLQDDLVERLFLPAGTDLFIVIFDTPIGSFLLLVILFESIVKELVVHFLNGFVAVIYIESGAFRVNIFRRKIATVVIDRTFPDHCTDRSFQNITSFSLSGVSRGFVQ